MDEANCKAIKRWWQKQAVNGILLSLTSVFTNNVTAAPLDLAQKPLFLGNSAIPNILLMMDDSGSMDWQILTKSHYRMCTYMDDASSCDNTIIEDGLFYVTGSVDENEPFTYIYPHDNIDLYNTTSFYGKKLEPHLHSDAQAPLFQALSSTSGVESWISNIKDWRILASEFNTIYYNPDKTYLPWEGSGYSNASFFGVNGKPDGTGLNNRPITGVIYIVATDDKGFNGAEPSGSDSYKAQANGMIDLWDSFDLYNITSDKVYHYKVSFDKAGSEGNLAPSVVAQPEISDSNEVAAIQQNYANWYQYNRRRFFNQQSAMSAMVTTSPNYRYMLGTINEDDLLTTAPADNMNLSSHSQTLVEQIRDFELTAQGTPLRAGLHLAGSYFKTTGSNAPIENACQLNFTVLMTDGFWNGLYSSVSGSGIGDSDGDGFGSTSNPGPTVADIAHHYYANDLRPDLADSVPASSEDSNSKQHMNTIVFSFGLQGTLSDDNNDGWPDSGGVNLAGNSSLWGDPFEATDSPHKINDLWHSAFNSKGKYVNTILSSSTLLAELNSVLENVDQRTGSSASVTLVSGSSGSSTKIYQSRFNSTYWSGDVYAYSINSDGSVAPAPDWKASDNINVQTANARNIIFSELSGTDQYTGKAFRHSNLSSTWKEALRLNRLTVSGLEDNTVYEQAMVDYLRGDTTYEGLGFRTRDGKLGDIVNSSPVYVGKPTGIYNGSTHIKFTSENGYSTFVSSKNNRTPVLYVGANDGLLHGLNATTGSEIFAYTSGLVRDNVSLLADPDYTHRYFFNATPVVHDVYGSFGSSATWKTILVSGLGGGSRGLVALDVTDPATFTESGADSVVLWEFRPENRTGTADNHDTTDPDMGHVYGNVSMARLNSGQWAVITGNGYNSTENSGATGEAVLFILDVSTGKPLFTIKTGVGDSATPNGLSETVLVDTNNDGTVDLVYAGDLLGNLWKFDLSSSLSVNWGVAYKNTSNEAIPLFSAGSTRPITGGITVGRHPAGLGRIVYFGTGRYLTEADNSASGQNTQAFYGIWDKDTSNSEFVSALSDAQLLAQTVTAEITFTLALSGSDGSNVSSSTTVTTRETSRHSINWSQHNGWYLTLTDGLSDNRGERIIAKPLLRNGNIVFTTLFPSSDSCQLGGESWLMELNAASGSGPVTPSLDLNGDGVFNEYDYSLVNSSGELQCSTTSCVPASGLLYSEIISSPAVLHGISSETKYLGGSSGSISTVSENPMKQNLGRQGWRELFIE